MHINDVKTPSAARKNIAAHTEYAWNFRRKALENRHRILPKRRLHDFVDISTNVFATAVQIGFGTDKSRFFNDKLSRLSFANNNPCCCSPIQDHQQELGLILMHEGLRRLLLVFSSS